MEDLRNIFRIPSKKERKVPVVGKKLSYDRLNTTFVNTSQAPYGLMYGVNSSTATRALNHGPCLNEDDIWDVTLISENASPTLKGLTDFEQTESKKIQDSLRRLTENLPTSGIMNLPNPSRLFSRKTSRKYITETPSLKKMANFWNPKEIQPFYNQYISNGPKYMENGLESPMSRVTVRRNEVLQPWRNAKSHNIVSRLPEEKSSTSNCEATLTKSIYGSNCIDVEPDSLFSFSNEPDSSFQISGIKKDFERNGKRKSKNVTFPDFPFEFPRSSKHFKNQCKGKNYEE